MPILPDNWTIGLPYPAKARSPAETRDLEGEVVSLFDQLRNRLLRYVLSLGVSIHDGEEIVQEVFLLLFQHLRAGRSRRNLHGWVFRVAHNLASKQCYSNRKFQDRLGSNGSFGERQLDPAPNPEEELASNQKRQRLLAVFRALPEQDQQCLRLRAEGLRYREIAGILGISLGAVSISLTRSLARLGRVAER
jgi:RNA polymerase sigma-70 factor, ECF subfamily